MELRHLRHFLAVADTLHMGQAAERLGMAQPPLSQSIARLERSLGTRLFCRTQRRLQLTEAGQAFRAEALLAVQHAEAARADALAAAGGLRGELRLGFVSAALYERLPQGLARLRRDFPAITPRLLEMTTNEQLAALANGSLDLGFVHPPLPGEARLDCLEFPGEPCLAAIPASSDLQRVTLAQLADFGLVLFPQAQGPWLHAALLTAFADAGVKVEIVQEGSRTLTLLSLVAAGLGATLLPRSVRRLSFAGVRYVEIDAELPLVYPLALARRCGPMRPLVQQVWHLFEAMPEPGG
ncbi:MAG: LysR family transcriptional regulator [Pseudomonas oryzihabitans]